MTALLVRTRFLAFALAVAPAATAATSHVRFTRNPFPGPGNGPYLNVVGNDAEVADGAPLTSHDRPDNVVIRRNQRYSAAATRPSPSPSRPAPTTR